MKTYFTKRLLGLIPTLIGIIAIFSIFFTALPGDALSTRVPIDPKLKEQIRHELHLDEPKIIQLKYWLKDLVRGDLGISQVSGEPINPIIKHVIKESFPFYVVTFFISILISIPLGIISAYNHNSFKDRCISVFSMIGISLPEFMTAVLLLWIFTYKFSIFPSPYLLFDDIRMAGEYTLNLKIKYSILPTIVLIICTVPGYIKYTRAGMLEILKEDYIRTAKSKGVREKVILYRHALKNAIIPLMTYIPTSIQSFITATIFVDITFQRSGIGTLLFGSIFTRDYPLTMATNLVITLVILLCNFIIDILYAFVDPRIKFN